MSRVSPLRASVATGLTLGTTVLALAVAPAALAAPGTPTATLSSSTVAPGAEFTISGTGCLPRTDGLPVVAVFLPAVDPQWADTVEPGADGSWSMTQSAPAEVGSYEYAVMCDRYVDGFDYANVTVTVTPDGKPVATAVPTDAVRGKAANTPGIKPKAATSAVNDRLAAPGEKVVRTYPGFQPFEVVRLTLHSTPQNVGVFTADAKGVLTVEFTVPAGTPVGADHTLVLVGDKGSYFQESFEVTNPGDARLADTGASVALPLTLGLGLLAAGGGLVVATRRRSTGASQA